MAGKRWIAGRAGGGAPGEGGEGKQRGGGEAEGFFANGLLRGGAPPSAA